MTATSAATLTAQVPVLVVGAGPVGLVLAYEVAAHGVPCVLVDRSPEPTRFPKMDITNGRSLELLRPLGLVEEMRRHAVPSHHRFDVLFVSGLDDTNPTHRELGRWPLVSVDEARRIIRYVNDGTSPAEPAMRCPQSRFEAELRHRCHEHPLIDVRPGVAFRDLVQDTDGVTTTLVDAQGHRETLRSAYVVGCDGASSAVRRHLGIGLDGMGQVVHLDMVHFRSGDRERLQRFGPFWHLYFRGGAVLIAQDEVDTYTLHVPADPGSDPSAVDPVERIRHGLGAPVEVDEVLLTSRWTPNALVAERYRDGRVFLAGDAVHQVIPTGGYGLNTGLGDAVDLGWKLAAVVDGWGGPRLLDSYEIERRPVGVRNRDRSLRNSAVIAGYGRRANAPLIDTDGAGGDAARAALAAWLHEQRGENESFGVEYGYRYHDSPVIVHDGSPEPHWDPMVYTPTTWPGGRAPQVVLADGTSLYDRLGLGLTLVDLGPQSDDTAWERWRQAARRCGVPMDIVRVDDPAVRAIWERDLVLVRRDHHVAWRGDLHPDDPGEVLDVVRGVQRRCVT